MWQVQQLIAQENATTSKENNSEGDVSRDNSHTHSTTHKAHGRGNEGKAKQIPDHISSSERRLLRIARQGDYLGLQKLLQMFPSDHIPGEKVNRSPSMDNDSVDDVTTSHTSHNDSEPQPRRTSCSPHRYSTSLNINVYHPIEGLTPLHFASQGGYNEVVSVLLNYGADPSLTTVSTHSLLTSEVSPLLLSPAHLAAAHDRFSTLQLLANRVGRHILSEATEEGLTPLHFAIAGGNHNATRWLLSINDNILSKVTLVPSHENDISLLWVVRFGDLKMLQLLIGIDVNTICNIKEKDSLLHVATRYHQIDIVKYLLLQPGINHSQSNYYQQTPLHLAAMLKMPDMVELLLFPPPNRSGSEEAIHVNLQDWIGRTPLHWVARWGDMKCIQMLMSKGGDVNICDSEGETVHDYAQGHPQLYKFLAPFSMH